MEVIIFFSAFVATLLSSMSGGGASIVNLPVFLSLGMSFPLAVSVQKISGAFWVLPAARNYFKDRKINWRFAIIFSLLGLIGTYFGSFLVVNGNQRVLEMSVGILILILVTYTFLKKDLGIKEKKIHSKARQLALYILAPILGFYESFFGAGSAIVFSIAGFHTRGFDFVDGIGYTYIVAFPWLVFMSFVLIRDGYYDLSIMIAAVCGSILGAQVGSHYAQYKGNRFIKILFIVIGGILGLKLVLGL